MEKDFDTWNKQKKFMHARADTGRVFFNEREMWWCVLGVNIGSEQDGTGDEYARPVIIVRQFNLDIALVVPLTSRDKSGVFYHPVGEVEGKSATAILSQLRLVDKKRFAEKIGTLDKNTFQILIDAIVRVNFRRELKSSPPQVRGRGRSHL